MSNGFHGQLVIAALLACATQAAHAALAQDSSFDGCFQNRSIQTGDSLLATGQCTSGGTGGTGTAQADLGNGLLGVQATTNGFGNAEAKALFRTDLFFLPNQVVPLTVTMHLTGSISGGQANSTSFLIQAAIRNFVDFGITGADTGSGFQIAANGQSGVGSFADAIVSTTGTMLRDQVDIILTQTRVWNVGASGLTTSIGGYIDAQVVPAVAGAAMSVDFQHTATVAFSVPPDTKFTSEGFLQAAPIPEPSALLLLGAGLATTALVRRRRREVVAPPSGTGDS